MPAQPESAPSIEGAVTKTADQFLNNKKDYIASLVPGYFEGSQVGPSLAATVEDLLQF